MLPSRFYSINVDIFVLYHDYTNGEDYLPGMDFEERQELRWYSPPTKKLCAADLLNTLVYVPCNVEELLEVGDKFVLLDKIKHLIAG